MAKQPEYVMCPLCEDIIYGGPGVNPIPRECECKATRVIPTESKGIVQWDKKRYAEAGHTEPEIEYTEKTLDPMATRRPVPEQTLDDIIAPRMKDIM